MNGAVRLQDYPNELVHVACDKCGRRGQYRKANLIARHGPSKGLPDLLYDIASGCPKWSGWDQCGAVFVNRRSD